MKNLFGLEKQTVRHILLSACVAALAVAFMIAPAPAAQAAGIIPPPVPPVIGEALPAGSVAYLVGHGVGTQNYICLPSGAGFAYTLFTPQATLFDPIKNQIITHFFSPNLNPFKGSGADPVGTIRVTWQAQDTSTVWAKATAAATHTSDPTFVKEGAVAWLTLQAVGAQNGPTGGGKLTKTTFIQRLNTVGGLAPSTGCSSSADVGHQEFVPYRADYFFFR